MKKLNLKDGWYIISKKLPSYLTQGEVYTFGLFVEKGSVINYLCCLSEENAKRWIIEHPTPNLIEKQLLKDYEEVWGQTAHSLLLEQYPEAGNLPISLGSEDSIYQLDLD